MDALPPDAISDLALPTPMLEGSPYVPQAWRALFNFVPSGTDGQAQSQALLRKREDLQKSKGDSYPVWVLNQTDTAVMLANRVAMGRGLTSDRFKWVPFVDMFLFPLQNKSYKNRDPEHAAFFGREEALLARYLKASGNKKLPANFDDYLTFVSHQLESWKADGAVAFKFELAYLRDLRIGNPTRESAERIYAIYAQSSEPTDDEYRILQDFVFRHIATEAGRLSLPIHIHSSLGAGTYFQASNANPLALEGIFNDPSLRRTKFVLLHGAWPFSQRSRNADLEVQRVRRHLGVFLSDLSGSGIQGIAALSGGRAAKGSVRFRRLPVRQRSRLGRNRLARFSQWPAGAGAGVNRYGPRW